MVLSRNTLSSHLGLFASWLSIHLCIIHNFKTFSSYKFSFTLDKPTFHLRLTWKIFEDSCELIGVFWRVFLASQAEIALRRFTVVSSVVSPWLKAMGAFVLYVKVYVKCTS